jgi:uncharacterized repeat protein (TIGR03803 family)
MGKETSVPDQNQQRNSTITISKRHAAAIVFSILLLPSLVLLAPGAAAQNFRVLHTFTGGQDGAYPYAGLVIDKNDNLYGTANLGGRGSCPPANVGCGTVFKLVHSKSGWTFQRLYAFRGGNDGQGPYGRVTLRSDGNLYGTTIAGGIQTCPSGCGTVLELRPPIASCQVTPCPWTETVLYRFKGNSDGFYPSGDLAFNPAGNIYGTTTQGGSIGPGTVYELKPSNGKWSESIVWSLTGGEDGGNPYSGVILDSAGNIFGTAIAGGTNNSGSVFELTSSKSGWTETTLHDFFGVSNGVTPQAGLLLDKSGNLIGATEGDGSNHGGTVYSLTARKGGWSLSTIDALPGPGGDAGPWAKLSMDATGKLYGTTQGYPPAGDYGTVFELTHSSSGWKETILHHFTGGGDGEVPYSTLVFDAKGNLYGTTNLGGSGYGVVFEITP